MVAFLTGTSTRSTPIGRYSPRCAKTLFVSNGRAGYSESRIETQQVKAAILSHGEFKSYQEQVSAIFDTWRKTHEPLLVGLTVNSPPKAVINGLSEDLLARFADLPLLERYDVLSAAEGLLGRGDAG